MFDWMKRRAQLAIIHTYETDIDRFISGLRGADDEDVAAIVGYATHYRHLIAEGGVDLLNPLEADQTDPRLTIQLNSAVREFQKDSPSVAVGPMVWLHTVRASTTPEIRIKGREMWRELSRGFPHVLLVARNLKEVSGQVLNITDFDRVPRGLEFGRQDKISN